MSESNSRFSSWFKAFNKFIYEFIVFAGSLLLVVAFGYAMMGDGYTTQDLKADISGELAKATCQYYVQVTEYWPADSDTADYVVRLIGPYRSRDLLFNSAEAETKQYMSMYALDTTLDSVRIDLQTDCYDSYRTDLYQIVHINTCDTCNQQ